MSEKIAPDLVRLKLLNDQTTPYPFVIKLLETVFGKAPLDAQLTATTAHHYGEADCGLWPSAVADALLATAQARINEAGHRLAFSRSVADGYEVVGQGSCSICGKPEGQARSMYRSGNASICDRCILDASEYLSETVASTQFKHAFEALSAHFGTLGLSDIETSVRSFPLRMRADLQLGFDQILSPDTVRQLGIKAGLRQDADIFFVLTTNRPEHLELALAGRPGRIDQAIEFPLPDEQGRLKLALLYGGELQLDEGVRGKIVQRTEGVSAAFIKELMRRISQRVIEDGAAEQRASEAHVLAALDEMMFAGGTLNAQLLGAGRVE